MRIHLLARRSYLSTRECWNCLCAQIPLSGVRLASCGRRACFGPRRGVLPLQAVLLQLTEKTRASRQGRKAELSSRLEVPSCTCCVFHPHTWNTLNLIAYYNRVTSRATNIASSCPVVEGWSACQSARPKTHHPDTAHLHRAACLGYVRTYDMSSSFARC